jgi:hypothetical protein
MGRTFAPSRAHRTYAHDRAGGNAAPPVPTPTRNNMMWWGHGYGGGIISSGGVVSQVLDWAGQNQHLDQTIAGKEPSTGVYTIDGLPTWSSGPGATGQFIRRNATMKKPDTTPLTTSDVRTIWSVILPQTSSAGIGFPITGGPVFTFDEGPYFEPLFDLESFFHANGWYLFDTAWRFDALQISGPDTPAATFNNIPQIVTWVGAPDAGSPITVYLNGVLVATSPANSGGVAGPSQNGFGSLNCRDNTGALNNVCFQGAIGEQIAYLGNQPVADPPGFAQNLTYLRFTYPSGDHP